MKKPLWIILGIAALVVAIDQFSKYLVATYLPLGGAWSPLPGPHPVFQIVYTYNTGVAFGLFKDLGPIFIGVAAMVIVVIVVYARQLRNDQWLACVSLGLMLGGALGNVIDRIRLGHVIDFIDVGVGATRWYTSNLSDVAIVSGVILLGVATLFDDRRHKKAQPAETQTPHVQP